jgi:large subunit ribosomal protein L10
MIRVQKEDSIKLVKNILSNNEMVVLVDYKGLNAGKVSMLRTKLKDSSANFKIFKNTLFKRAIKDTEFGFLERFLFEQVAISYSNDPISLSNVINAFIKDSNSAIKVKAVALKGIEGEAGVIEKMASLGSFDDIRARFIGVLRGAGSRLVGVLEAYAEKMQG